LRLPAELAERLESSARRLKRKRSDVVRQALEQYLDTEPNREIAAREGELFRKHRKRLARQARALIKEQARS
jgi:predicted transcriptional regulator